MFNVGPEKLILLFVIALVVLGPQRLPHAARTLGRAAAGLRRLSANLQTEMHGALGEPGDSITEAVGALREGVGTFRGGWVDAFKPVDTQAPPVDVAPADGGVKSQSLAVPSNPSGVPDEPSLN